MKKPAYKTPQLTTELPRAEIVWLDACLDPSSSGSLSDPLSTTAYGGTVVCRDIGYLIAIERDANGVIVVKLATSLSDDSNDYRHANSIPWAWVKSLTFLGPTQ
jgi:hypothetical protein